MAAVTALSAAEPPVIKPTRSMTHPLRDPKVNTGRRVKQGEPFDPEELSRRLTAHLAEQKIKAERRRDANAAKAVTAPQNAVYHHVPKMAAAAFERTTTPDNTLRPMHKASHSILKATLELVHEENGPRPPNTGFPTLKETQAKDQAMIERELLRNRNQFQWDRVMEEAVDIDIARDLYKPPQRTFEEFAHLRGTKTHKNPRPLSTGDVFSDKEVDLKPKAKPKQLYEPAKDRNDWAQRDDDKASRNYKKEWASPFLRKKESIWILGRKDKSPKQEVSPVAILADSGSPPDKKGRFLARFKRHPS